MIGQHIGTSMNQKDGAKEVDILPIRPDLLEIPEKVEILKHKDLPLICSIGFFLVLTSFFLSLRIKPFRFKVQRHYVDPCLLFLFNLHLQTRNLLSTLTSISKPSDSYLQLTLLFSKHWSIWSTLTGLIHSFT